MGDQYKLYYFNSRGLAEPSRQILSYAEADWEDIRFPAIPDDVKARAPFGQVPLLEVNGQIISQSSAIARFLARKYNLAGANDLESARCDEIVDAAKDLSQLWYPVYREQDPAKKAEGMKKATEDSKTRFLSKFNELLTANDGHFVGKSLTWADIVVAHFAENLQKIAGDAPLLEEFPALQNLIKTVQNTPRIKEWIEKRPETQY